MKKLILAGLVVCTMMGATVFGDAGIVDAVRFGQRSSESRHQLKEKSSEIVNGELGLRARQLMPNGEDNWRGGKITFTMKVDPERPNYFTAKFWGGEMASHEEFESRLALYIKGEQVGNRQLGAIEMLDIMGSKLPRYPGRFTYKTLPLPLHMTQGQQTVEITIEAQGGINGYTKTIEQYQRMFTEPSRKIYCGYVHTRPCFEPLDGEVQGEAPAALPVRSGPGPEVLDELKTKLNTMSESVMQGRGKMKVDALQYLAYAYTTPWNVAYKNPKALTRIVSGMDWHCLNFLDDPSSVEGLRWVHKGPAGDAVRVAFEDLKPFLDEKVKDSGKTRGEAWGAMFVATRDFARVRRRSYSNQSMITDINIYYCNRAAALLGAPEAWPEEIARRLLYESLGLEPWSGNWDENGVPDWSQGKNKRLLTKEGLTKELGYVGGYGEIVQDLGKMMYDATKPPPGAEGDPRLKAQLIKMTQVRAPFRYPLADADGCRAMILENSIGWRDWKFPGRVMYDQMNGREGGSFGAALSTMDPALIGYAQQMLEDNQYFAAVETRMKDNKVAAKTWLLSVPEDYEKMISLPRQAIRLPMSPGQPDFVFADTEDGLIALKNGDDILYASLYWRARNAVNNLARVHHLTPVMERDATVHIQSRFNDSGLTYTIPDQPNMGFGNGRAEGWYKEQGIHNADAGLQQPIAKVPADDVSYKVGKENIHAGKSNFYLMSYGRYFVAMNCTENESYPVDIPAEFVGAQDLVSGQLNSTNSVSIAPQQTMVLYR
jgi:hypothetical protein